MVGKTEHCYETDGPLTDTDIAALTAAAEEMGKGNWNKPSLIENEHGVYVAPAGAIPGEGESFFGLAPEDAETNAKGPEPKSKPVGPDPEPDGTLHKLFR